MDPGTRAFGEFQAQFRAFRENADARVLLIDTDVAGLGAVRQALQAEEWHPKNRSPFLVFSPRIDRNDEHFVAMAAHMRRHYDELRTGLAKEGTILCEFGSPAGRAQSRWEYALQHLVRWLECTRDVLDAPLFCWLVPVVAEPERHAAAIRELVCSTGGTGVRFVFNDDSAKPLLSAPLTDAAVPLARARFRVDEGQLRDWFRTMMLAPPKKGRAPGTPPGAAAPDVEPPARRVPARASDEQIRRTLEEAGLPPALTAGEGEQLQRLLFSAAEGMVAQDVDRVLRDQHAAYQLCVGAGVPLEGGMMALVLAGYLVQFGRDAEACDWFWEAACLARAAEALPQVSQALTGMAYVHFKERAWESAASIYLMAADAATEGGVPLLAIENLRMAGLCFQNVRNAERTIEVWFAAIEAGRKASPGEVAGSNLHMVISDLTNVLRERRMAEAEGRVHAFEHELALTGALDGAQ